MRLRECPRGPGPLASPHSEAFEGAGHSEFLHRGGAHVGSPREVRLTRERSPTPGFNDALGGRAQASYL